MSYPFGVGLGNFPHSAKSAYKTTSIPAKLVSDLTRTLFGPGITGGLYRCALPILPVSRRHNMFCASLSEIDGAHTYIRACTFAPPIFTGTRVGAPPRFVEDRPNSTLNGVSANLRSTVAASISLPGSVTSDPKASMPIIVSSFFDRGTTFKTRRNSWQPVDWLWEFVAHHGSIGICSPSARDFSS